MSEIKQRIVAELQALEKKSLLRRRYLIESSTEPVINFCSNDYLSLAKHPRIQNAYQEAFQHGAIGSGGSMLLGGYHPEHHQLERAFAEFLDVDSALLFSSGYAANLAMMMLAKKLDLHCMVDKKIHASVYDGLALSKAEYSRFMHNDHQQLGSMLKQQTGPVAVMTEGIFSMSGQIAAIDEIRHQLQDNQFIWLDEAHSFGVTGRQGRGLADYFRLDAETLPLRVIPLGKSCAAHGAVVAGQSEWIELLLQFARSYIYSTAISPAMAKGMLTSLDIISDADERRLKLNQLIHYFIEKRKCSDDSWVESQTAIQYLKLSSNDEALAYHRELAKEGIHCFPVRTPTVPLNECGIRFVLNYHHRPEDIEKLFNLLQKVKHEGSC